MAGQDKTEIRTQLHAYLVKNHASVPAYIRNKVSIRQFRRLGAEPALLPQAQTKYYLISLLIG